MNLIRQPMLAAKDARLEELEYPAYGSTKLDGIRMVTAEVNGKVVGLSRKFVLIPNTCIQQWVALNCVPNLDGEIMVRKSDGHGFEDFNAIQSAVMSETGQPDFVYVVFDYVKSDLRTPFKQRYEDLRGLALKDTKHFQIMNQRLVNSAAELQELFDQAVGAGFEGAMYRKLLSPYKCGRSTLREGWLVKIKLFDPTEAEIIGFNELEHNQNPEEYDAFGNVKRSHAIAGKVGSGMLGSFACRQLEDYTLSNGQVIKRGTEFDLSGKMILSDRLKFWQARDTLLGKIVRYKFQGVGTNGRPRFPVFLGFRDRRDV